MRRPPLASLTEGGDVAAMRQRRWELSSIAAALNPPLLTQQHRFKKNKVVQASPRQRRGMNKIPYHNPPPLTLRRSFKGGLRGDTEEIPFPSENQPPSTSGKGDLPPTASAAGANRIRKTAPTPVVISCSVPPPYPTKVIRHQRRHPSALIKKSCRPAASAAGTKTAKFYNPIKYKTVPDFSGTIFTF